MTKFEEGLHKKGKSTQAFESMLARFNRSVQEYGLLRRLKECRNYEKPSVARSRKKLNKELKARRENALRKERIQGNS